LFLKFYATDPLTVDAGSQIRFASCKRQLVA